MAGVSAPSRAKYIRDLQRFVMDWELCVPEHEARHNEYVLDTVMVVALQKMMTAEMAERCIEGYSAYEDDPAESYAYGHWRC